METTKNLWKLFCIAALFVAFVYGLVLPFCWGNNPASELGTLSLLCEDRKIWFWIWGILTSGSIILNTQYMYRKFSYKNKLYDILCAAGFISVCVVALTLGHSIEDWNPKRVAHWVATGFFIAFTLAPIVLFFITNIKKHKQFRMFTLIAFLILGTFILIFAVVGKSSLMEMIPIAMMEIFLFVINFTSVVKKDVKLKESVK